MKRYFLGIDQGTTGSTALLIDEKWNVVATRNVEHTQIFPKPGWVEHDPMEIWNAIQAAVAGERAFSDLLHAAGNGHILQVLTVIKRPVADEFLF